MPLCPRRDLKWSGGQDQSPVGPSFLRVRRSLNRTQSGNTQKRVSPLRGEAFLPGVHSRERQANNPLTLIVIGQRDIFWGCNLNTNGLRKRKSGLFPLRRFSD